MRTPKYLSPSSLSTYETDETEFYLKYLADNRPDRIPQTQPMAAGSAFDAYAKSYLHEALFGKNNDPKFAFDAIFTAQVEPQNRDWAKEAGMWAFEQYKHSGALADLMLELGAAVGPPSFEFDVMGVVNGYKEGVTIDIGVPILGKPDIRWIHKSGAHMVYDWKVNGFCGKGTTSPEPKYVRVTDGWNAALAASSRGGSRQTHKDFVAKEHKGVIIGSHTMESVNPQWATQLGTYGWLLGESIGSDFVCGVDQLCCKFYTADHPLIRVAQHRAIISEEFQFETLARYQRLWHKITSGHFFTSMSLEESQAKCKILDENSLKTTADMSDDEKMMIQLMRS